jgi:hypothetical protein
MVKRKRDERGWACYSRLDENSPPVLESWRTSREAADLDADLINSVSIHKLAWVVEEGCPAPAGRDCEKIADAG